MTGLREQIERLLLVVSLVRARPGVALDDVAAAVGVTPAELRDELLPLLSLVGKPPFSPADLIDLWLDDAGRLHLELDQSLGRPLRLTAEESLALQVALEAAASSGLTAFADRARALAARLATLFAQAASSSTEGEGAPPGTPLAIDARADAPHLGIVERAVAERRALVITYFTASRDAISTRRLEPWALVEVLGAWYVIGRDGQSGEGRMFKVERIADAQLTDDRFAPPSDFDPRAWVDAGQFVATRPGARAGGGVATVRVRGPSAELVLDEGLRSRAVDGGAVEVELPYLDPRWAAAWVMALGDDAALVGPEPVARALAERAAATLALYDDERDDDRPPNS